MREARLRPLVIAHRGAPDAATPENTIAAFERARIQGADWIELDVRRTREHRLVVRHDAEAGGRRVETLTHSELKDLTATDVPTLAEALTWAAEHRIGLDVELKEDGYVDRISRLLDDHPAPLLVTSFSEQILRQVERRKGLLITLTAAAAAARARRCGADALIVQARLLDATARDEADAAGLELLAWDFLPGRDEQALRPTPPSGLITDDVPGTLARLGLEQPDN